MSERTSGHQNLVSIFPGIDYCLKAKDSQDVDWCRTEPHPVLPSGGLFVHFLDVLQVNSIPANEVVNNLGVYFDPELLMGRQVNKLCQVCYFHLRRLRTVRRSLTKESLLTLVHAFITSRVDHCNGVLYGSNGYLLDRLQSVLNSAARLILGVPKFDSVSAAIRNELHWLPIGKRIQFKIALLVRHCIVGAAPEYLTELCRPVSSSSGRQSLRSASRGDLIVPRFRLRRSGYRAFAVSGPHVWNSLPTEIRQSCDNLLQFKSKLKHFCSSSPEPFCGSIFNEGPYKYSIPAVLNLWSADHWWSAAIYLVVCEQSLMLILILIKIGD